MLCFANQQSFKVPLMRSLLIVAQRKSRRILVIFSGNLQLFSSIFFSHLFSLALDLGFFPLVIKKNTCKENTFRSLSFHS
jgi:hypothetical protein